MLQSFRDNLKGMAAAVLVAVLVIPFALYGVDALFLSGSSVETALLVNGERINELRVNQVMSQQKNRILSENEGLDPALIDDQFLRPQAIQQIVAAKVIAQAAQDEGMAVSPRTIGEILLETDIFLTDGKFDNDRYQYFIRSQGHTNASFKELLKEDFLNQQFTNGVLATGFVSQQDLSQLAAIAQQSRDYHYLTIPVTPLREQIEIGDDEIAAYYETHKAEYQTAEQVVINYIELTAESIAAGITIDDAAVSERFEQELANINPGVLRHAAHILLENPSQELLASIRSRIDAGEDFAALAKEFSTDFGSAEFGGDLGFTTGDAFPEAFEKALAQLRVGEVSTAVETDAGTHLIKLLEEQASEFTLETESLRIADELRTEAASRVLAEKVEQLKELSFNAENLAEVAEDLTLTVQQSQPMTASGGTGVAAYPVVLRAAFSEEVKNEGFASEVLELADGHYVVLKLSELIPSRQQTVEEMTARIRTDLLNQRTTELLDQRAAELVARLNAGETVEQVAKAEALDWQVAMKATANSAAVNAEVRQLAFRITVPAGKPEVASFSTTRGDRVVIALHKVEAGNLDTLTEQQRASLAYTALGASSSRELRAYRGELINQAEIEQ